MKGRGRPREYYNRYPLSVSVEKDLWEFANQYGILARDAISIGLQGSIEHDLIRTKKIPPSEIDRYMEIKDRELRYLAVTKERESHIINTVSEISESVEELVSESRKTTEEERERSQEEQRAKAEKLYVYDYGDDTFKVISREKYQNDPEAYKIYQKPQEDS